MKQLIIYHLKQNKYESVGLATSPLHLRPPVKAILVKPQDHDYRGT